MLIADTISLEIKYRVLLCHDVKTLSHDMKICITIVATIYPTSLEGALLASYIEDSKLAN